MLYWLSIIIKKLEEKTILLENLYCNKCTCVTDVYMFT